LARKRAPGKKANQFGANKPAKPIPTLPFPWLAAAAINARLMVPGIDGQGSIEPLQLLGSLKSQRWLKIARWLGI
jgi:hypothetical protein